FEKLSGVPVLLNTSFNENEPIVDTPAQALECFLRTKMDGIVAGDTLILRDATNLHPRLKDSRKNYQIEPVNHRCWKSNEKANISLRCRRIYRWAPGETVQGRRRVGGGCGSEAPGILREPGRPG